MSTAPTSAQLAASTGPGPRGSSGPGYRRALERNERFAARFDRAGLSARPSLHLAVLTCMDARIQVEEILGLDPGEAHCIRNAGGLATDDALRSLVLSHHLLGTDEILVIEHTACGQLSFNDDDLRRRLVEATGQDGGVAFLGFSDLEANLWAQVERIRAHPWLADVAVTGLIYDVRTGRLHEVGRP